LLKTRREAGVGVGVKAVVRFHRLVKNGAGGMDSAVVM
jgi:hypothetical protein